VSMKAEALSTYLNVRQWKLVAALEVPAKIKADAKAKTAKFKAKAENEGDREAQFRENDTTLADTESVIASSPRKRMKVIRKLRLPARKQGPSGDSMLLRRPWQTVPNL
jgi:hypothetical protein